ncbi:MAG TPA: tetratricopeptide repeat protein [Myxococcota bacterium]|nr:tetratricopeptide repeat protein [Myxococcota bacterium]HRY93984.1 tetratricopeptide repeat protein [Myxococcota bacterium]
MSRRAILASAIILTIGAIGFVLFFTLGSGQVVFVREDAVLARDRGEHLLQRRLHTTDPVKKAELLTEAIKEFQKAAELKPDFAVAYNMLGHCYIERGQWEDALKQLDHAIELKPDYPAAKYNRARVYQRLAVGKTDHAYVDRAIADYKAALDSPLAANIKGDLHKALADAYQQKGDLGPAIDILTLYLQEAPKAKDAPTVRRKIRGLQLMRDGTAPPLEAPLAPVPPPPEAN